MWGTRLFRGVACGGGRLAAFVILVTAWVLLSTPTPAAASGCTITWVGDVNNNWHHSDSGDTNWDDDTLPDGNDHVCLENDQGGPYTVQLNAGATVNHYSIQSQATLAIGGGVIFRALADSSNAGTISLSGNASEVRTENGTAADTETLTNTATGTIAYPAGTGTDPRIVSGNLLNQGTVSVAHPLAQFQPRSEVRPPTLINDGTINVATGGQLKAVGGAPTLRQEDGGTINGPGTVAFEDASMLEVAGGEIDETANVNLIGNSSISFVTGSAAATGHVDVEGGGSHPVLGTVAEGFEVEVQGGTRLTSQVDFTNEGTLILNGNDAEMRTENGDAGNAETLTNEGTIEFVGGGPGTGRPIVSGNLLNQGTITIDHVEATFLRRSENRAPKLTNAGTIEVASERSLIVSEATLSQADGGTINGPGQVEVRGSSVLEVAGGEIDAGADVNLTCCTSSVSFVTGSATATGHVDVQAGGQHPVGGTVPSGFSIQVNGGTQLTSQVDFTNKGTLTLNGNDAEMRTENGNQANAETLTNEGTIEFVGGGPGTGRPIVSGDLLNEGAITVDHVEATFLRRSENRAPKLTNSGTIEVASGRSLVISEATLSQADGGTIGGPGQVEVRGASVLEVAGGEIDAGADVKLTCCTSSVSFVTGSATATGHVVVHGGGNRPVLGTVAPGFEIEVRGGTRLTSQVDFTNEGTITINGGDAEMRTENGNAGDVETLTNEGTIAFTGTNTPGSSPWLSGDVINEGTISVTNPDAKFGARTEPRPPTLANPSGNITVAPLGQLTMGSSGPLDLAGGFLSGSGTLVGNVVNSGGDVRPGGSSVGNLDIQGSYTQSAGGTLSVDVVTDGVDTVSDRLAVTGAANVAGALDIDTDGGKPPLDTRLQILTAASRAGNFSEVSGLLGGAYAVEYFSDRVELLTVLPDDVPALSIDDASVIEGDAGNTDLVLPVTISPTPDTPTQVEVDYETANATASASSDYTATTGTLTFTPGDTSEEIHVPVSGDNDPEPNETLLVRLRDAQGAPMRDARAQGTILGDEVTLDDVSPDSGGTPGSATITVSGTGFGSTSTMQLSRGAEDIEGTDPLADPTGTRLTATFDLTGAELGEWDVAATGNGGEEVSSPNAFTVEPARTGRVIASATIPPAVRTGFVGRFVLTLRNTANTDARIEGINILGTNVEMRRPGTPDFVEDALIIGSDALGDSAGPPIGVLAAGSERTLTIEFRSTTLTPHANLTLRGEVFTSDGLASALERSVVPGSERDAAFPPPPGRIDGTVVDSAGRPVAGVPVTGEPENGVDRVVLTGGNGAFAFTGLADGSYDVSLGGGLGAATDRRTVEIGPSDRSIEVDFEAPIAPVSGSVRDTDGTRLDGAIVHLRQDGELIDTTDSDGAGNFRFLVVRSGTYDLVAFHDDIGVARLDDVAVSAGTAVGGLRINAGSGRLEVNTDPGAIVAVRPAELDVEQSLSKTVDGSGEVEFPKLAAGEYEMLSRLAGKAPRLEPVTVGAGTATLDAPLSQGAELAGTVTGDGGAGIRGAIVWAIDPVTGTTTSDATDGDGDYLIDDLSPGAAELWFTAAGYAPEQANGPNVAAGGSADVDAALSRDGRDIEFTALSGSPGTPVPGVSVTVLDPSERVPLTNALTTTDGIANLGPLTPDTYRVEATAPGMAPVRRDLVVAPEPAPRAVATGRRAGPTLEEVLAMPIPSTLHFPTHDTFEGLALEGKLGSDWYAGFLPPPQRAGKDTDPAWRPSYQDITYERPCPNADHIRMLMVNSSFDIQRTFSNWLSAHQALQQLNGADVGTYLAQAAQLGAKLYLLGRQVTNLGTTMPKGVDFATAQFQNVTDLGATMVGNYRTSGDPGLSGKQGLFAALGQLAGVLDLQLQIAGKTPAAGPIASVLSLINDVLELKKDLDDSYSQNFRSVIDGYEQAEDQYHAAVQKHAHLMRLLEEEAAKCPDDDEDDPTPAPDAAAEGTSDNVAPNDPNDIDGPFGTGPPERWITPEGALGYAIRFENIGPGTENPPPGSTPATAPAVLVTVEHTLDPAVDLDTFTLGSLGWGDIQVDVPGGLQEFHGEVPLADGDSVYVDASLDRSTRKVTWRLATIDPETGELEDDPEGGFLPPEPGGDDAGAGQGRVTYTARLLDSVAHASTVDAEARIVFDFNPPIDTPTHTNTVDRTEPTSEVTAAVQPGTAGAGGCLQQIDVDWSGSDTGSGLGSFTILVSENSGPFETWLAGTEATSGSLLTTPGSRYEFISLGRDRVGNQEPIPTEADEGLRTERCDDTAPTVTAAIGGGEEWRQTDAPVRLSGFDGFGGAGVKEITYALSGAATGGETVEEDFTDFTVSAEGVTTVTYSGEDFAGNAAAERTLAVRIDRTDPTVTIASPAAGATVPLDSALEASYSCADALSGVASCEAPVAPGAPLPTSTPGQKTFTVTATDEAGNERTLTRTYTVGPAPEVDFGSQLKVSIDLAKMKKAKKAPIDVVNSYDFPIEGQLRLVPKKKGKPLTGWKPLAVEGGDTQRLALKLKGKSRRKLDAGNKLKARVLLEVTNSAGQERSLDQKVKLKLAKKNGGKGKGKGNRAERFSAAPAPAL